MREEAVFSQIEQSQSVEELHQILQNYIESKGFAAYAFIDNSHHGAANPLILHSVSKAWDRDYRSYQFLDVDPCLPMARSSNTPFTWSELPPIVRKGKRRPRAMQLMDAAQDHRFKNGMVIPFHYRDHLGAYYSAVCTLFWTAAPGDFLKRLRLNRYEVHMVLLYWAQQVIDLATKTDAGSRFRDASGAAHQTIHLTDREKEVLLWSAQGKTSEDIADILCISRETVDTHFKSSLEKLDAASRTQAVVRAMYLGLIVP